MMRVRRAGARTVGGVGGVVLAEFCTGTQTQVLPYKEPPMRTTTAYLMSFLAACSHGGPTEPGKDPGGNSARVVLTIRGEDGVELDMTVRYVIADGPTTRVSAAAMRPVPFGCFADVSPSCPIDVPVGKTITFFAIEGEGVVAGDRGNGRPVPPPDPRRHEFVSFVGDCETNLSLGDCSLHVTAQREYAVRADFALMRLVIFGLEGAGSLMYGYSARDRLAFPNHPYPNPDLECCAGGGGVAIPASPLIYAYLPRGSTVSARRKPTGGGLSLFIQWDGLCSSGGGVLGDCTQIVGAVPPPQATAVFEYYDCGPQGYTDGGTGPAPPPGCVKVRP